MVQQQVTMQIPEGLHMRPAGLLANALTAFAADITLEHKGQKINAKSVISLMQASIACGDSVTVICEGSDEKEALSCAVKMLQRE